MGLIENVDHGALIPLDSVVSALVTGVMMRGCFCRKSLCVGFRLPRRIPQTLIRLDQRRLRKPSGVRIKTVAPRANHPFSAFSGVPILPCLAQTTTTHSLLASGNDKEHDSILRPST